ncbi:plant cysteine oxidase 3 [Syzygium oleosum]|uniref:plant cysteine oxidase 3 n=1 Tax=Syzygium oleosum TaxID=219896 RepID=UPI0011D221D7|nr:plant cysteine oxidase 3 [Syzygium oleosum]
MLLKLRKLTRDNSVRWLLQNGALFFSTKQASMAPKSPHSHKVQALYDLCRKTFPPSGTPPLSSHSVQKLCSLLDTIGPADVGLSANALEDDRGHGFFGLNQLGRVPRWAQPITYVDIHECESFTICVFCFPTSAVIPLHDHPAMTVFSKVLYGSLHVKAYDWVEPARILNKRGPVRLAKLAVDNVLTAPCTTSVLYPKTGGNLHCFTAITPCAVLDILSPPYSEDADRRCTYYCDYPYFTFANEDGKSDEEENYAWLAETGTPDDLYMRPGKYNGPAIQV